MKTTTPLAMHRSEPSPVRQASQVQVINKSFPIVGIGASAGGLEAFSQLLRNLPQKTGMAFTLVQHLDPKYGSILPETLSRVTKIPVREAADNMVVEPDHVYVIPPNTPLAILHGVLHLIAGTLTPGQHTPIDYFLRSLAQDRGPKAIGVILSGTASNGAQGLEAIKAAGGITFAQDEKSAEFAGMPQCAIAAGCVDLILPPRAIASELSRIGRHPYLAHRGNNPADAFSAHGANELRKIFLLLRNATGVDFTYYEPRALQWRVRRRMVLRKLDLLKEYVAFLESSPREVEALFRDFLIHVTGFFRDPEAFLALPAKVFPEIMANRKAQDPVRIWVPGCSTGEEAYSVAISFLESLRQATGNPPSNIQGHTPIQIVATDVARWSIEKARLGLYPESIAAEVSPERLKTFFVKTDGGYQISKPVRDMCVFARQNVTKDAPFSGVDLITCRNLLACLEPEWQTKVLLIFHSALKPRGFLMLGTSETAAGCLDHFAPVDRRYKIYARKEAWLRLPPFSVHSEYPAGLAEYGKGRGLPRTGPSAAQRPRPGTIRELHKSSARYPEIAELKPDVTTSQEQLQSIIQGQESSGEKLCSANKEILSSNGKLQRAKEKLEIAEGELQPSNEEFSALNQGLQNRNLECRVSSSDLKNLLDNVDIPIVMLGNGLRIRLFTPSAQMRPKLLPADLGRHIGDIKHDLLVGDLEPLAQAAMESLALQEQEVQERRGRWYRVRIRPYRTAENKIDGAVLVLTDIDLLKRDLDQSRLYAEMIVETARDPLLILDVSLRVKTANRAFYRTFRVSPEDTEKRLAYGLGNGQWNMPRLRLLLEEILPKHTQLDDFEVECEFPDIGRKTMLLNARRFDVEATGHFILLSIQDITERKRAENMLSGETWVLEMIAKCHSLPAVLKALCRVIEEQSTGLLCSVLLLEADGIHLRHAAAPGLPEDHVRALEGIAIGLQLGPRGMAACQKKPVIVSHILTDPLWAGNRASTARHGLRACWSTPILSTSGQVLGTFAMYHRAARSPNSQELQLLKRATRLAAFAIERKQAENEVRQLSGRLLQLQDEERRRIARELHDSAGQKVAALAMDLAVASEEAAAFRPKARQALAECFTLAEQIAAEVRTLSYLLHPPLLDESGLASAIRWYADGLAQRSGLHVNLEVPPEFGRLPPERETTLFRIVQESLTNALLHFGSKKASNPLVQDAQQVPLEVSDEGRGLAPETLDHSHPGPNRLLRGLPAGLLGRCECLLFYSRNEAKRWSGFPGRCGRVWFPVLEAAGQIREAPRGSHEVHFAGRDRPHTNEWRKPGRIRRAEGGAISRKECGPRRQSVPRGLSTPQAPGAPLA